MNPTTTSNFTHDKTQTHSLRDKEIFSLIDSEHKRQVEGLEMIASENYASNEVMLAQGSILTNKYAEGYPDKPPYWLASRSVAER